MRQPTLYLKFLRLNQEDQDWVLEYLSTGKGVILYQMITDFDSLGISPEKEEFFSQHLCYSSLKDSQINIEDYENVKKLYAFETTKFGRAQQNLQLSRHHNTL